MKLGLDIFVEHYIDKYKHKRVGLVTNPTGVNKQLVSNIDLFSSKLNLVALFSPEHGIRGYVKEGKKVGHTIDEVTGLPIYSLYGDMRKPNKEMLDKLDVVIFDIQDIGTRYYTFIYTLAYVMEACKEYGKELVVLDRPNPINGRVVVGNIVKEDFFSFVGLLPIPTRHGMTIGELAILFNEHFNYDCNLQVIKMEGWKRDSYFDELNIPWVSPSPNVTSISMQILYSGTCLVEGTNLSEGRGTVFPFEVIGAPFIDARVLATRFNDLQLDGILARPISFIPTYQKHKNEVCHGVQLHLLDRNRIKPINVALKLLEIIYSLYPDKLIFIQSEEDERAFIDLLAGDSKMRASIINQEVDIYLETINRELEDFKEVRKRYLIYD